MTFALFAVLLTLGSPRAQQAAPEAPASVAVAQLPVLADQMRAQRVEESELRALLETTQGSGVSMDLLVGALEVVVRELEAGIEVPNLAVRLPAMISQGLKGEELAQVVRQAGQSAAASAMAAPVAAPVEDPASAEEPPAPPSP